MARRSRHSEARVLVAAATRVRLDDKKAVKKAAGKRQDWQDDAWAYFDLVPEIKYSTWFLGNAMSKLRLYVATADPEDDTAAPIPVDDERSPISEAVAVQAIAELRRLAGGGGGVATMGEILREANMNLEISAEAWLVGRGQRIDEETGREISPERWEVHSVSEVQAKQTKLADGRTASLVVMAGPDDKKGEPLDPELDTAIRFWQRHPRWGNLPDCAMRGVLDECETLLVLSRQARAESRSRLPAGILVTPSEFDYGSTEPGQDDDTAEGDPFLNALVVAMTTPIQDESSPAGLAPMLARVPSAPGDNLAQRFFHIDLSRKTDEALDARIKTRIERIARGLNLPVEVVMGHQQTTFANAEQVDQNTFDDHLEPRAILLCDIFTGEFLRQQLREAFRTEGDGGTVPDVIEDEIRKVFVWYDPTQLVAEPDLSASADSAFDRFTISDAAYRRAKGYDESDAPELLEVLARVGLRRGIFTADLSKALVEFLGQPIEVEESAEAPEEVVDGGEVDEQAQARFVELARLLLAAEAQRRGSSNGHTPPPLETLPALAAAAEAIVPPDENPGRRLVEIDRDLRARLLVLADRTMTRALERAGAIIKSKAPNTRELVRNVPNDRVGATLGHSIVANAGVNPDELLEGAFDAMEEQFMAWGAHAQQEALEYAVEIAGGIPVAEREALKLRQAEDLAEAWAWARETLEAQASARLFDPESFVQEVGEVDPNLRVQAGIIRQAMTRAGGTRGVQTGSKGEAWVSVANGGQRPAGGIGTGELIRETLESHDVNVEAYRWIYGPAARKSPFEPHVRLAGVVFQNFDDEVLANHDSFPPLPYYLPGDHAGCLCDFEPVIVPRSDLS